MPGIGVIYNPRSGQHVRDPKAAGRLQAALGDHGVVREAGSIDELYRVAEDFRRLRIDVLAISGGDGTNSVTITGFLSVYGDSSLPAIAFLRGGTMNTCANSVGVRRGRPTELLRRLARAYAMRAAAPLRHVERHVLALHGDASQRSQRGAADAERASICAPPLADTHGFIFGTGVVCGYLAEYYGRERRRPTPIVAAKTLLRGVGSALMGGEMVRRMAEPFRGSVELEDGTVWEERDYLSIAGGTIDQIGLRFRPFRRCAEQPGRFHVLGIHTSPMGFIRQLPRIWRAAPMAPGHTFEATATSILIHSSKRPIRYMVDGDLHECDGPLRVSTGPRVRLVVGT